MGQKTKPTYPSKEDRQLLGKKIQACIDFSEGKMSLHQLWYRFRGDRCNTIIQRCPDPTLSFYLHRLYMDFLSWRGERDDLIADSARQVTYLVGTYEDPNIH